MKNSSQRLIFGLAALLALPPSIVVEICPGEGFVFRAHVDAAAARTAACPGHERGERICGHAHDHEFDCDPHRRHHGADHRHLTLASPDHGPALDTADSAAPAGPVAAPGFVWPTAPLAAARCPTDAASAPEPTPATSARRRPLLI